MFRLFTFLLILALLFCTGELAAQRQCAIGPWSGSIRIDGDMQEQAWQSCAVLDQFTQTVPEPDRPSRFRTEVRIAYGEQSLYVFARLFQPESLTLRQITARDMLGRVNADVFTFFLDTYNDRQNGYAFRVSAAGVQQDERLSEGNEYGDLGWDAVWSSAVSVSDSAWCVEMEIPYSAIRFSSEDEQVWRVNFLRQVRKLNESSYWSPIDVNRQGFLAQSGLMKGLLHLRSPVRLFLFPYLSTGLLSQPNGSGRENTWLRSGGTDLKYGINEAFTLDMTLIPDFSQVVSDNLIRNLSPFEQQLTENRPFFTEGTELFNKAGLFYTRRVGARPSGYSAVQMNYADTSRFEIARNPNITRLYNAFKISGRTRRNTGIGLFNAVGAPVHAEIRDKVSGEVIREETEPFSNYNVLVIDQPLRGQSFINLTNTNVMKRSRATDANVSALQWVQFTRDDRYRFSVTARASVRHGTTYSTGTSWGLSAGRVSGRFNWSLQAESQSPGYSQRDMGIQFDYNHSVQTLSFSYNQNKPKQRWLQLYQASTSHQIAQNTRPFIFKYYQANASLFLLFKNFWDVTFTLESRPLGSLDFYQLGAFGKTMRTFPYYYSAIDGSSDSRKKLFWAFGAGYGFSDRAGADYIYATQQLRYMLGRRAEVSVRGDLTRDNANIGFSALDPSSGEPLVARRYFREMTGELNLKFNLNADVNLTARFRHYNGIILNRSVHFVDDRGQWESTPATLVAVPDENYNLQNIDFFLNWMYRPGSRLVLSYKQWLQDAYLLNTDRNAPFHRNVYGVIQSPKAYELNLRLIYFLDYNSLEIGGKKPPGA